MWKDNNGVINEYNYELPPASVAQNPIPNRHNSNLLIYKNDNISSDKFYNISNHITPCSLLVFNNSKVIQARLIFKKDSGAAIEIFCLEPYLPSEYASNLSQTSGCSWHCLVGNAKKWKQDSLKETFYIRQKEIVLTATQIKNDESFIINFKWNDKSISFADILEHNGKTPLPPYIKRDAETNDKIRYQTIYAKQPGSVAAPTAGLHFSDKVFNSLREKNIKSIETTLHVSAGTFIPLSGENYFDHIMHRENFFINDTTLETILENISNIYAVGTTSLRTLESIFHTGVLVSENSNICPNEIEIGQWESYKYNTKHIDPYYAVEQLLLYMKSHKTKQLSISTSIMIVPGYKFRMIKGLITNFHQPKSTLLLLISAFTGDRWKDIYKYALKNDFRFLSYGDSSLLIP